MRSLLAALLVVSACTYDYIPAPRGPRTVCSGTAVGQSYGYRAAAWGQSSCEQIPAETCNPADDNYEEDVSSGACADLERDRIRHNREVAGREHRDHVIAGVLGVLVGVVLVVGLASQ